VTASAEAKKSGTTVEDQAEEEEAEMKDGEEGIKAMT